MISYLDSMAELNTEKEFTGDMAIFILGVLFCLPLGIVYYISNKEELWVCPSCQETINKGASTCRYCNENLDNHK